MQIHLVVSLLRLSPGVARIPDVAASWIICITEIPRGRSKMIHDYPSERTAAVGNV
jgi:hypothetical protein